ncbi:MAG: phosphoserine phosphatase SerB [Thalassotalea sp.]|nr:phosphoserine phosphatase SerB [Thalassotalea sp.]
MATSQTLSANDLNVTIGEYLNPYLTQLPVKVEVSETSIAFAQHELGYKPTIELVLFCDSTMQQLLNLIDTLDAEVNSIIQFTDRVGQQSLRFGVECVNLSECKSQVNNFALENNIEAALIANAPSLSIPGLLVMDMDSTTIEIECIDEIAKLAGVGEQVSAVTERAMQGELDFAESLRERVGTLKDAPEAILSAVGNKLPLMPGLEVLVKELHQHDWKIAVASGGFTYFTQILKEQLNLDATQANVLEIVDGKLTGKVIGDITDAQVKADTLLRLADEFFTPQGQMVAMGDGANDLAMLAVADLGVAYKAKPVVLQQAQSSINSSGLDCLLHWLK